MSNKRIIRNIPTHQLLLLLAQANSIGCPFVDVSFDVERRNVSIIPISKDESRKRFTDGKEGTDMEDLISES